MLIHFLVEDSYNDALISNNLQETFLPSEKYQTEAMNQGNFYSIKDLINFNLYYPSFS